MTATFDASLVCGLKNLCGRESVTLFMTLLAAFQTLLARTAGKRDIVVGCPVAGRDDPLLEDLIGPFINTIPFRAVLDLSTSFRALLRQSRTRVLEALAHSDVPFEKLVEELRPERSLGHGPLFQVFFQLRNLPQHEAGFPGLKATPFVVDPGVTPFDLSLELWETTNGLSGSLEYSLDLFERETATRLLNRYRRLLEAVVADPDAPIEDVQLLTQVEQDQVLRDWNATELDLPFETCLHRLFEEQAVRSADAIAVTLPDVDADGSVKAGELTYAELNRRANRLARHLRALGSGPDLRVAIFAERSLELVVAMLGAMKSGAAYLPIDPATPAARLKVLFADARPVAVVTQAHLARALAGLDTTIPVVALSSQGNDPPGPETDLEPINSPNDLAYVIYTSGSTGSPKGVMNEHRGVCNMILWMQHALPLGPTDCVAQKTPYTFDLSVWEFFWPLIAGRDSCSHARGGTVSHLTWLSFSNTRGYPCAASSRRPLVRSWTTPSPACCTTLRRVFTIGEPLTIGLRDRFYQRLGPGVELHNLYGPTEAAVEVTHHHCIPDEGPQPIPIGARLPIPACTCWTSGAVPSRSDCRASCTSGECALRGLP